MKGKTKCSWGHPALTEKQVIAIVENMIPTEFRPYYIGIDVQKQVLSEPFTEWNTDIMVYFKAPVCGCCFDSRTAHSNLSNMEQELTGVCHIDEDSIGNEDYAEWDEEHNTRRVKEIMPLKETIVWHKPGYDGEEKE